MSLLTSMSNTVPHFRPLLQKTLLFPSLHKAMVQYAIPCRTAVLFGQTRAPQHDNRCIAVRNQPLWKLLRMSPAKATEIIFLRSAARLRSHSTDVTTERSACIFRMKVSAFMSVWRRRRPRGVSTV